MIAKYKKKRKLRRNLILNKIKNKIIEKINRKRININISLITLKKNIKYKPMKMI